MKHTAFACFIAVLWFLCVLYCTYQIFQIKQKKLGQIQDKNITVTIRTTLDRLKQGIETMSPHSLTTHVEEVFSINFITYLFMCATEGQAFDDLFVIIFISSHEKS